MIARPYYLDQLRRWREKDVIKVVSGIRRCGKSTLLSMFRDELLKSGVSQDHIISLNLEGIEGIDITEGRQLLQYFAQRLQPQGMNYIFIDEVQQVEHFEKAVDALYVQENCDVYVTGSNSRLLSGELATLLSGRYVEIRMQPLSFAEYVSAHDGMSPERLYRQYLTGSSFPYASMLSDEKDVHQYLSGIYDTVILKDIIGRRRLPDVTLLKKITRFLFDNIGNPCSTKKIADTLTSMGSKTSVPTIEHYLAALQDAFLFYRADRYDLKGKDYLKTGGKYYAADLGLRQMVLGSKPMDAGHMLENVIYLELLRRYDEVYVGKVDRAEIDFAAVRGGEPSYFQVAYTVTGDGATLERELLPFKMLRDYYPRYLLTMDLVPRLSHDGIQQIYALDWLLDAGNDGRSFSAG